MIWPFSVSSKLQELPAAPAIPTIQRVLDSLNRFKEDVLSLDFIHADSRDVEARGRFLASIERVVEQARSVDWTADVGARIARNLEGSCLSVVTNAQGGELTNSFSSAFVDSASHYQNPFIMLSIYYGEMRKMSPARVRFELPVEAPAERITFPDYSALGEDFRAELQELATQWQVRADQELSVENRYLVDALATSYLPESISLYASLSKDPAFAAQASEMFAKQLALFTERLATIEDATSARQLQAMAAHSAFLEERLRPEPTPIERLSIAR